MTWKKLLKNNSLQGKQIDIREIDKTLERAYKFLRLAEKLFAENENMEDAVFKEAYDAMIFAGRALIYSFGFKPRTIGSHLITIEFCRLYFGTKADILIKKFGKMRKRRNYLIYGTGLSIYKEEAENALRNAKEFINLAEAEISRNQKQQKLI